MKPFFVGLTIALSIVSTVWYCYAAKHGKAKPVLATWLIFAGANTLALFSYFFSPEKRKDMNFESAVSNITWAILSWVTLVILLKWHIGKKKFETVHAICITLAFVGLLIWKLSGNDTLGNLSFQGVLIAGYYSTFDRLWRAEKDSEQIASWYVGLATAAVGFVPPFINRDWLHMLYTGRSFICVLVILWLIKRLNKKRGAQSIA